MKIVTGFQTGVDIAAARAAKAAGLLTGGAMPKQFLTLDGPRPEYATIYGAFELPSANWNVRTRRNVRDTEATFLFVIDADSRGTYRAVRECERIGRPFYIVRLTFPEPEGPPAMEWEGNPLSVAKTVELLLPFASVNIGGNRYTWLEEKIEPLFFDVLTVLRTALPGNTGSPALPIPSLAYEILPGQVLQLALNMESE
jgi:hypothetical protein